MQTRSDGTTPSALARSRRVLVVEDDPGLCDAVVRLARSFGAEVFEAHRLEDAFRLLDQAPDLVVADLQLEGQSALPLIEAALGLRPPPAVVAMSGQASAEESFRLGRLGVRAYLAKPFGSDALLAAVERAEREPEEPTPRADVAVDVPSPGGSGGPIRRPWSRLRRLLRRG